MRRVDAPVMGFPISDHCLRKSLFGFPMRPSGNRTAHADMPAPLRADPRTLAALSIARPVFARPLREYSKASAARRKASARRFTGLRPPGLFARQRVTPGGSATMVAKRLDTSTRSKNRAYKKDGLNL